MKLKRPPLVLALAQTRFSSIMKMRQYVPDIQERLRQIGFPLVQEQQMQQIVFGSKMEIENKLRWVFSRQDRRHAVVLTEDFVVNEICPLHGRAGHCSLAIARLRGFLRKLPTDAF